MEADCRGIRHRGDVPCAILVSMRASQFLVL